METPFAKRFLTKNFVSIYSNVKSTRWFLAGLPLWFNNKFVLLWVINKKGHDDGYALISIDSIYRIEWESIHLHQKQIQWEASNDLIHIKEADMNPLKILYMLCKERRIVMLKEKDRFTMCRYIIEHIDGCMLNVKEQSSKVARRKKISIEEVSIIAWK